MISAYSLLAICVLLEHTACATFKLGYLYEMSLANWAVESYSQFKLWVIMKSPLVLGTNWAQLADLATLEPTYAPFHPTAPFCAMGQKSTLCT